MLGNRLAERQCEVTERIAEIAFSWPCLWLEFPDTVRGEISAAHGAFAAATAAGTWAWPYLLLATLW